MSGPRRVVVETQVTDHEFERLVRNVYKVLLPAG
jgi:hypothetical protein